MHSGDWVDIRRGELSDGLALFGGQPEDTAVAMDEARNRGYGSEYHLRRYLTEAPNRLSDTVVNSIQLAGEYPPD
jgi:hypothetical protein